MDFCVAGLVVALLLGAVLHSTNSQMHFDRDKGLLFDLYPSQKLSVPKNVKGARKRPTKVQGKMECVHACVRVAWCLSVNFKTTPLQSGLFACQLLSFEQFARKEYLKQSKAFNHYSVKNPCQDKPCYNGGKCIFQDNRQDYRCACTKGFTAERCEKEKDILWSDVTWFANTLIWLQISMNVRLVFIRVMLRHNVRTLMDPIPVNVKMVTMVMDGHAQISMNVRLVFIRVMLRHNVRTLMDPIPVNVKMVTMVMDGHAQ
ncbi:hypothetical protein QZH41_011000, partial [Actinostola sp. cb2023]